MKPEDIGYIAYLLGYKGIICANDREVASLIEIIEDNSRGNDLAEVIKVTPAPTIVERIRTRKREREDVESFRQYP